VKVGEGSDPGWENPDSGKHKEGARTAEKNRINMIQTDNMNGKSV
jgi:hypothetical protein